MGEFEGRSVSKSPVGPVWPILAGFERQNVLRLQTPLYPLEALFLKGSIRLLPGLSGYCNNKCLLTTNARVRLPQPGGPKLEIRREVLQCRQEPGPFCQFSASTPIGGNTLVRDPNPFWQGSCLPEYIDGDTPAGIPVAANPQPLRI